MANNRVNPPASRAGTGFVNLQKYLQANKNNQLGQNIAQNISGLASGVKSNLGQTRQGFSQDVSKSILGQEDEQNRNSLISKAINQTSLEDRKDLQQPPGNGGQPIFHPLNAPLPTAPGVPGINDDDVKAFEKYRSGLYSGPQDLSSSSKYAQSFGETAGKAREAEQLGQATKTAGGRESLLQTFVKGDPKSQYTSGQRKLDTLFLGGEGGKALGQARKNTLGLQQQTANLNQDTKAIADAARVQNQQFGAQTREALGINDAGEIQRDKGAFGQVINPLQQRLQAVPDQKAAYEKMLNDLNSGDFGNKLGALSAAGVDTGDLSKGESFYGLSPADYLKATYQTPTLENVASTQDYAKLNALSKLAGQQQGILKDPTGVARVEQLKPYEFAGKEFNEAVGRQKQNYLGQFKPTMENLMKNLAAETSGNGFTARSMTTDQINQQINQVNALREAYGLGKLPVNMMTEQQMVDQKLKKNEVYDQMINQLKTYLNKAGVGQGVDFSKVRR